KSLQQVVEIVRNTASQLADGLHLLRLQKLLARRLQRLLGFPPLGDVAGELGEADQLAVLANGVQHAVRPEAAAVLAEPPALLLVDAFARRGLERLLRHLPL